MVRLQTLDLRIGVRIPASQPHILKDFFGIPDSQFLALLRLCCGLLRTAQSVEPVYERNVGPWNEMPVDVHGHLD